MQADSRLLDDLARVASGAMGAAGGLKGEIEGLVRRQLERLLAPMELVARDEFDAVKEMAAKARAEQEDLAARFAALEAKNTPKPRAKSRKTSTKSPSGEAAS